MPVSSKSPKSKTSKASATKKGAKVDLVIDGPMLYVPTVLNGNITDVEVFSPLNDHPVGAVFLPELWFTDEELNNPESERWPEPQSFSLLDPHSYAIHLTQSGTPAKPFPAVSIPDTNHKVKPGRKISGDWEIAISLKGNLGGWTSPRLANVTPGLFHGSDSPTGKTVALTQKLTYEGVTGIEFCGAPPAAKDYLSANIAKGGTLIILGEIYFRASMRHEKKAIEALAKLAGLDLHLMTTTPAAGRSQLTGHLLPCLSSVVVV